MKGKLLVRLPFAPGGANHAMLHECCGTRTHVTYNKARQAFEITATHLDEIVGGLLYHIGAIDLTTEYYAQQTCVEKCWTANPGTALTCVCGCAGLNHGSGTPFDRSILGGKVSVQGQYMQRTEHLVCGLV